MRFFSIALSRKPSFAGRTSRPFFWANGRLPSCEKWTSPAKNDFRDYRLKVYGLVENPVELSLDDLRALGKKTQITLITASRAGPASPPGAVSRWQS